MESRVDLSKIYWICFSYWQTFTRWKQTLNRSFKDSFQKSSPQIALLFEIFGNEDDYIQIPMIIEKVCT